MLIAIIYNIKYYLTDKEANTNSSNIETHCILNIENTQKENAENIEINAPEKDTVLDIITTD